MSDFAKHLPLSQHERSDDAAVSADRAAALALVLTRTAVLLDGLPPEHWTAQATPPALAPAGAIALLLWRLDTPVTQRRAAFARQLLRTPLHARTGLQRRVVEAAAPSSPVEAAASLRAEAAHGHPAGVAELTAAVSAYIDVAGAAGTPIELEPLSSGAVALYQFQRAPYSARAAVRGRRLHARDAGWTVGTGITVLEADATEILVFLFGRARTVPGSEAAGL